jgi:hypothetical protein
MKTIILSLTGTLALLLTGCTDQQARQYSEKINAILQNYQSQIKRNIDSEQRAYEKLAAVYETEKQRDVFESLDTERTLRSGALSAMLVEGPAKPSAIIDELEKYAGEDFDRTQKIYAEEMDAESSYLKVLDSLQAETKRASDLSKILAGLAKPANLLHEGNDLASFGQTFQTENAKQSCLQIQSASDVAQANAADAKAIADTLQAKADLLKNNLSPNPTDQETEALNVAQTRAKQAADTSDKDKANADAVKAQLARHPNFKADSGKCQ